jgi:ATP-dependent Clp protease ATP-binding subunit ClpX
MSITVRRSGVSCARIDLVDEICCSFCGQSRQEVRKLISGPNVYICDECVDLCNRVVDEEEQADTLRFARPHEMVSALDRYVVGQSRAKKVLSVAVYNHFKRISYRCRPGDVELAKGNIMVLGPTGVGKTLLAQALARRLDVPFAIADATALTEAGYVGEDVESIIKTLYRAAGGDAELASRGIVCIDEIDKLARRGGGPSASRDVSGEGVQQALLKLLEGRRISISPDSSRTRPQQQSIQIDTRNIVFFLTGAFRGIEEIVRRRVERRSLGFGAEAAERTQDDLDALRAQVRHEDLVEYGLVPEFIGRIPVIVACNDLAQDDLVEVLWRPKNALIRQYEHLMALDGVRLQVTDGAMAAIAAKALRRRSGARGLRAVLEEVMLDVMYEIPSLEGVIECTIDEPAVTDGARPKLTREKKAS